VRLDDAGGHEPGAAVVMQTSGSTGSPLTVPLAGENLIANGSAIIDALGLTEQDRVLASLPFGYSFGLSLLHTGLASGGCIALTERRGHAAGLIEDAGVHRATVIGLVPTLVRRVVLKGSWEAAPDLRMVQVAGGALDVATTRSMLGQLPDSVAVQIMYGLTEATARVSAFDVRAHPEKLGSVGRPIAGVQVEIEQAEGVPAQPGEQGRIAVGGRGVCRTLARPDGFFVTADLGRIDADGFLWIDGRDGDFVKVGDKRTSMAPVERAALDVTGVEAAVAVAVPDRLVGERVGLLVGGDDALRPELLIDELARVLPRTIVPAVVRVVRSVPLTTAGKINRARAREILLAAQEGGPT
jgi:long-chain acyl-CoA synthetase